MMRLPRIRELNDTHPLSTSTPYIDAAVPEPPIPDWPRALELTPINTQHSSPRPPWNVSDMTSDDSCRMPLLNHDAAPTIAARFTLSSLDTCTRDQGPVAPTASPSDEQSVLLSPASSAYGNKMPQSLSPSCSSFHVGDDASAPAERAQSLCDVGRTSERIFGSATADVDVLNPTVSGLFHRLLEMESHIYELQTRLDTDLNRIHTLVQAVPTLQNNSRQTSAPA
ncbi:unnamed protein product [Echinostoma caproni]|uniref:Uncharacterized protein n=1 Tax=Echinostoma caproni TaxID=27848 RepID=A0A183AQE0_9TREM|nr:unnamed protein product [Echinostoma caproni]